MRTTLSINMGRNARPFSTESQCSGSFPMLNKRAFKNGQIRAFSVFLTRSLASVSWPMWLNTRVNESKKVFHPLFTRTCFMNNISWMLRKERENSKLFPSVHFDSSHLLTNNRCTTEKECWWRQRIVTKCFVVAFVSTTGIKWLELCCQRCMLNHTKQKCVWRKFCAGWRIQNRKTLLKNLFFTHTPWKQERREWPLNRDYKQKQMVRLALSTTGLSKEKSMTESSETVPLSVQHE